MPKLTHKAILEMSVWLAGGAFSNLCFSPCAAGKKCCRKEGRRTCANSSADFISDSKLRASRARRMAEVLKWRVSRDQELVLLCGAGITLVSQKMVPGGGCSKSELLERG